MYLAIVNFFTSEIGFQQCSTVEVETHQMVDLHWYTQSSCNCNIRKKIICQTNGRVSKDGFVFREMNRLCVRSYCAVPRCFCEQFEAPKTSTVGTRVAYEVNK